MPRPEWRPEWLRAALLSLALCAGPSAAADDAALRKDLAAAILLLGVPCGDVVTAKRQAQNDHLVSCANGHRYRVFVNGQGRLIAQRQ